MIWAPSPIRSTRNAAITCTCYCMLMLTRRLQVLIDEDRYRRIAAVADERGVAVAVIVREAIDRAIPTAPEDRSAAARCILEAAPMPVPDVAGLRAELDAARSGGA